MLRLRRRERAARDAFRLNWRVIDADRTAEHPGTVLDLQAKRIDGITVRGIFTPAEIDRALACLGEMRSTANDEVFGQMLGMPLLEVGAHNVDRTPYHDSTERARPMYREAFGFDPHERLASILEPMAGHYRFVPPVEDGRPYNPGNIRWYEPGRGGLRAHVGNEFVDLNEHGALTHLLSVNAMRDWMSYFVVLQPCEVGGSLSVFDLLYADTADDLSDWQNAERLDERFSQIARERFDPQPGDLTMFCGGWRYHQVDQIGGSIPRITYGGFSHASLDDTVIHMWA